MSAVSIFILLIYFPCVCVQVPNGRMRARAIRWNSNESHVLNRSAIKSPACRILRRCVVWKVVRFSYFRFFFLRFCMIIISLSFCIYFYFVNWICFLQSINQTGYFCLKLCMRIENRKKESFSNWVRHMFAFSVSLEYMRIFRRIMLSDMGNFAINQTQPQLAQIAESSRLDLAFRRQPAANLHRKPHIHFNSFQLNLASE